MPTYSATGGGGGGNGSSSPPSEVFLWAGEPTDVAVNWSSLSVNTGTFFTTALLSSGAQNDEVGWDVFVPSDGTYKLNLVHRRDANRGIYTITIGGASLTSLGGSADTIDGYNGSTAATVSTITGLSLTGGQQRILLKMATKNASSSGYYGDVSAIILRRTT